MKKIKFDLVPVLKQIYPPSIYTPRAPFEPIYKLESGQQYVFIGSRTSGKTHTMAAISLALGLYIPSVYGRIVRIGYSLPTRDQIQTISKENFVQLIRGSEKLKEQFPSYKDMSTVFKKEFRNGSLIKFFWQEKTKDDPAEKARGTHPDILVFDEIQDIVPEFVGILSPATLASPFNVKYFAGTFKTEYEMSYDLWKDGTQHEWIVKCPKCGTELRADETIIDFANLEMGPFCNKCGYPLKRKDIKKHGRLVALNPGARYVSLRFSGLFNYWTKWSDFLDIILNSKMTYDAIKNEIIALPVELSGRPLTESDIRKACDNYPMYKTPTEEILKNYRIFAGIDWSGGNSNTVVTIIGVRGEKYYVLNVTKFSPLHYTEESMMEGVLTLLRVWKPGVVYMDWGMSLGRAPVVQRHFNAFLVYFVRRDEEIKFSHTQNAAQGNKHVSLEKLFHAIKTRMLIFPRFEDIEEFVPEYTSYVVQENPREEYLYYDTESNYVHDDALMSLLYAFYAARNFYGATTSARDFIRTKLNLWDYATTEVKGLKPREEF